MESLYFLLVLSFVVAWVLNIEKRRSLKEYRLENLIVNGKQIVEKTYEIPSGRRLRVKGRWKL